MPRVVPVLLAVLLGIAPAHADPAKPQRIEIQVTKQGFTPDTVTVPAAKPLALVFTRKTNATCAKQVVLTLDDGSKIQRELPLDTAVEIDVTFPKPGKLGFACSMDMTKGVIVVR